MITGNTLVRTLASKRRELEASASEVGSKISRLERELNAILTDEGKLLRQMASIHISAFSDLPTNVESILEKRSLRIEKEQNTLKAATDGIESLSRKRDGLEDAHEEAYRTYAAADAKAREAFDGNNEASSIRVEVTHLDEILEGLEEKYTRAVQELDEKSVAYHEDNLFMYLQRRGFGTPDYRSTGFVKRIDGWIANLISYRSAVADYKRLNEMPLWIDDRREKITEDRAAKKEVVDGLVDKLLVEFGVDKLSAKLKIAETALADIDHEIDALHGQVSKASGFISAAALANDEEMAKATKAYTDFLSRLGVSELMKKAKQSATTEDDKIVNDLINLERQKVSMEREIAALKPGLLEFDRRVKNLNDVERKVRNRGWSGSGDRFSGRLSDGKVDELASGMITAAAMWTLIESAHKRPAPESSDNSWGSTGGFGGGSYSSSGSSSSSSSSSGGGFGGDSSSSWSTGGGFGGGDNNSSGGF